MEKREITGVQGQVNNIEVIFKEYYGSLCYFASRFLKDEEVIEDLVQDVFITLLEKKMLFQSEVHLKNFLYLSIRNSCLNYIRSTRSKDRYIASLAYEEQAENFEESIILTEIHRELAAAVEKLPEECRKVFQLFVYRQNQGCTAINGKHKKRGSPFHGRISPEQGMEPGPENLQTQ